MIKSYKCKECDFETKVRGYKNAQFEIEKHFEKYHVSIVDKIEESEKRQEIEMARIEKEYPVISLGEFIESTESELAKLWECPRCKEKMYYSDRRYHEANAFRNDKEYRCVISNT